MKRFSDKYINDFNILKDAILGFEFEFYMKDLSYYKTLEILNQYLDPVKVYGYRIYHPDDKPDHNKFLLTPDLSGGTNMVEVVTGPMEYYQARIYLVKMLKFIQEYGYTNDKASIHFNLSFKDKDLNNLNDLKLILNIDEEEIWKEYPSRKGNIYTKSVKDIIPYRDFDYSNINPALIENSLRIPSDKYYGINFLNITNDKSSQRLEYRYIGGENYHMDIGKICYFLDKFIIDTDKCMGTPLDQNDVYKLEEHLDKNLSYYKNFSSYDQFIVEYPTVSLQVDQNNDYNVVSSWYPTIYPFVYTLIDSVEKMEDCIINFISGQYQFEVIDAKIKSTKNISNDYDFISCDITTGIFTQCGFVSCNIDNAQLTECTLDDSEVSKSKVLNCNVENTELVECFFQGGYLNGTMTGGVFRSGKLGPYADISSETKKVSGTENFFGANFGEAPSATGGKEKKMSSDVLDFKGIKK